jgi:hypothetical protein
MMSQESKISKSRDVWKSKAIDRGQQGVKYRKEIRRHEITINGLKLQLERQANEIHNPEEVKKNA